MQQKYELGTKLTYFWHKNEKKISLNFIFAFETLRFRHIYHALSKCASQIKLICGGGHLLVPGSHYQRPGCQDPMSQVRRPQGPLSQFKSPRVPESQVSESQSPRVPGSEGPGSQSLGFQGPRSQGIRSQGPRCRVSGPDFRLCQYKAI